MKKNTYKIQYAPPTVSDFMALRMSIGWEVIDSTMSKASLDNSLFHVTVYQQLAQSEILVAMGRVIGDGAMYFYLQDIIVLPEFQGQGLGQLVMSEIESYLTQTAKNGATIGLLAAKGKESFYQRFGYIQRPNELLGNGMCKFIHDE